MQNKRSDELLAQARALIPRLTEQNNTGEELRRRIDQSIRAQIDALLIESAAVELHGTSDSLLQAKQGLVGVGNRLKDSLDRISSTLETASTASDKQSSALVFWTKVMVGAIAVQAVVAIVALAI